MTTEDLIFSAVIVIPDAAHRDAFLNMACADDRARRERLNARLAAHLGGSGSVGRTIGATVSAPGYSATRTPPTPSVGGGSGPRPSSAGGSTFTPGVASFVETAGAVIAGKYKLLWKIADGGMGSVWVAEQTAPVMRQVAVKLIKGGRDSAAVLARFEAERQAIAVMNHPHIAKLFDAGTVNAAGGQPFFVMELVNGVPLTDYCDRHKLSVPDRLALFTQICSAVQHAHQKGVIHRDLKPGNILVESHDGKAVPKVIDFGLAKATSGLPLGGHPLSTGHNGVVGTPLYMAPEQADAAATDIDTRADVFALGVVLYELLTGTTPLTRDTIERAGLHEMLRLIREQEAETPSSRLSSSEAKPTVAANRQTEPAKLGRFIKGDLDWIVLKALAKDRDRRYDTANGLSKDVERFLHHEPVAAGPPGAGYRLRKFVRRNRPQVVAVGLVLLALVGGIGGTTFGLIRAEEKRGEAVRAQANEAERADGERLAKEREAEQRGIAQEKRAEAEADRDAKLKALAAERVQREVAVKAATAEKTAKETAEAKRKEAETNLAFAKKGNEILGSVFLNLDPHSRHETIADLRGALKANLKKAVEELNGSAIGDPLVVAEMQDTLGLSLLNLGEFESAVILFTRSRETRMAKLGASHPDTLRSMCNLASGYAARGDVPMAVDILEGILKRNESGGLDQGTRSTLQNNLATNYQKLGRVKDAILLLEEVLSRRMKRSGPDHSETLGLKHNLADAYRTAGRAKEAVEMMLEVVAGWDKLGEAYRSEWHDARVALAQAQHNAKEVQKAISLLREEDDYFTRKYGPDHPHALWVRNNLAQAYKDAGEHARAVALFEHVVRASKKVLPPHHPNTVTAIRNLGTAHLAAGRPDLALPPLREAAEGVEKKGYHHELGRPIVGDLIACCERLNHLAEAEGWRRKSLAVLKERAGDGHPACAAELVALARNLLTQRKWADAEAVARDGLGRYEKLAAEKKTPDWLTATAQSLLGGALLGQKKYAGAEPLLRAGYAGLKAVERSTPPARNRIPETLDRLIELCTATDQPDEAAKYRTERAKYREVLPPPRKE